MLENGFSKQQVRQVRRYLKKLTLTSNDVLIRQGETADCFYFVESGQVSIYLRTDAQQQVRLQTLSTGTLVGEVGFYIPRSTTIIADRDTVAYRLTKNAMKIMQVEEPLLALSLKI